MIRVEDWGLVDYEEALERQKTIFERLIARKSQTTEQSEDYGVIVFCEHSPVFTLGRNGREENILAKSIKVVRTDRGGDVTFHGPGQLVCYPILDLGKLGMGLREYIWRLEQSVVDTLGEFGIVGFRSEKGAGVWTGGGKICAIGVRASRGVVMHGLALNVSVDLEWFGGINPCGMVGEPVARMVVEMARVRKVMEEKLLKNINYANRKAMGDTATG